MLGRPRLAARGGPADGHGASGEHARVAPIDGLALDEPALFSLVARARVGDRAAFARLVERRLDATYRIARAILGSEADACDATQDAFLLAWRERARLRDPGRFDAWLGRIVVNSCRQLLRGRRRRFVREIAASDVLETIDIVPARDPAPDDRAAWLDALERAFEHLDTDERALLALHHLERWPVARIAAALDIRVGTVKSRLYAARQSLERAMEAELR